MSCTRAACIEASEARDSEVVLGESQAQRGYSVAGTRRQQIEPIESRTGGTVHEKLRSCLE